MQRNIIFGVGTNLLLAVCSPTGSKEVYIGLCNLSFERPTLLAADFMFNLYDKQRKRTTKSTVLR